MPPTEEILDALPRLRRFGQLLTGSETLTDSIIVVCLESIIENPTSLFETANVQVTLFRNFLSVVSASPFPISNNGTIDIASRSPIASHLPGLTFLETQAFLLRYVEAFDHSDTAYIMEVSETELRSMERRLERKANAQNSP